MFALWLFCSSLACARTLSVSWFCGPPALPWKGRAFFFLPASQIASLPTSPPHLSLFIKPGSSSDRARPLVLFARAEVRSLWLIARLGRQRTAKGCRNLVRITGNQTTEVTIKKSNTIPATFVAVEKRTEGDTTIDRSIEREASHVVRCSFARDHKRGKRKGGPCSTCLPIVLSLACSQFFEAQTAGLFLDWSPTFVSPRP